MNTSNNLSKLLYIFLLALCAVLGICTPSRSDPTLIISGHPDYPPYMWNQNGKLMGIGVEIAKFACQKLKLKCEIRPINSWKRVQGLAKTGEIDVIVGAYANEERRAYMDYTVAYMQDPTNIFVHKNRSFTFTQKEDLIGKRGVAMFGESYGQKLDTFIIDKLQLSRTYTTKAAFKNLKDGKVDYMLWGYYPWLINARTLGALSWSTALPVPIAKEGMHMTFSKKSSSRKLLPEVNKIINRLQQNGSIKRWRDQFLQNYQSPTKK